MDEKKLKILTIFGVAVFCIIFGIFVGIVVKHDSEISELRTAYNSKIATLDEQINILKATTKSIDKKFDEQKVANEEAFNLTKRRFNEVERQLENIEQVVFAQKHK